MELFTFNNMIFFILFFIPGFISMKVYHLLIASGNTDFSKSITEVIAFSSINYASLSWLIIIVYKNDVYANHFYLFISISFFIIFIAPILWTILYVRLAKSKFLGKYILSPIKEPWDFFFEKRKSCWVIVNLNSGERIGGVYSDKSYSSAFPNKYQLYLEELWEVDTEGYFIQRKERTNGIIIFGDEIKSLEFYND